MFNVTVVLKSGSTHTNHEPVTDEVVGALYDIIRDGGGIIKVSPTPKSIILFSGDEVSYIQATVTEDVEEEN